MKDNWSLDMEYKYISLGGWCGTAIALNANNLRKESLPFDHIRSTFNGVIDCISNNFINFFPKKIENEGSLERPVFKSKYFGFYYHHDLTKENVIKCLNKIYNKIMKWLAIYLQKSQRTSKTKSGYC